MPDLKSRITDYAKHLQDEHSAPWQEREEFGKWYDRHRKHLVCSNIGAQLLKIVRESEAAQDSLGRHWECASLLAEKSDLERMLAATSESAVIDRMSLEARREQVEAEIERIEKENEK